jgi:uncharacterized protein
MLPPAGSRPRQIIDELGLSPHPERGFFVETYRAGQRAPSAAHGAERAASTAIYFLVTAEQPCTSLHRLLSDEIFHLYEGGPLEVVRLFANGSWDVARLGTDLRSGERPQIVIPAGTWFGTELAAGASHCLIGCTVAPGFEFSDFELARDTRLEVEYPEARERIRRMLKPEAKPHTS